MVWGGAGIAILGLALIIIGAAAGLGRDSGPIPTIVPVVMLPLGLVIEVVGIFKRASEAGRRLAGRNFSWCVGCGYPFDERASDAVTITCPECGASFRTGEAREWNRVHPERLSRSDS